MVRSARFAWLVVSGIVMLGCRSSNGAAGLKDATDDSSAAATDQGDCTGYSDAQGDPVDWLKQQDQAGLQKVFRCAPPSATTPIGLGIGRGSLFQDWPLWNNLQTQIGTYIWGGKRLYLQPDGKATCLLNQMDDTKTERYMAHVYLQNSNSDGQPVVVLDYRVDNTHGLGGSPVQLLVDKIVKGIRDEIREVTVNGQGSQVFIGRANINKSAFVGGDLSQISDADFADPGKYMFAANFFLDFRPSSQTPFGSDTPSCVN